MKRNSLFGSSGIRDIVDRNLVDIMFQVGLSVGNSYRSVIIGSDTRTSSEAIRHTVIGALLASGADVYDAGIAPTPTVAYNTRYFDAGIMITASHNPPAYNGIKLCNPNGSAFDSQQRIQVEESITANSSQVAPWRNMGKYWPYPNAIEQHLKWLLQDCARDFNLKVVLDCGCGAGYVITPYLLERMGCEVIAINSHASGFFPRPSEPTEENLAELTDVVRFTNANVGIAHDGDADRMVAVDDKGRVIPGDKLLVILARNSGASKIVTTVDASMAVAEAGFEVVTTRVGDAFVSDALINGGDFGGEPSGAWIFPKTSLCPDGIQAAAQIIKVASKTKLSTIVDSIPSYPIVRGSIALNSLEMTAVEQKISAQVKIVRTFTEDGLKIVLDDGWILIRPSGTEPKMRITVEAKNDNLAQDLYNLAVQTINECSLL